MSNHERIVPETRNPYYGEATVEDVARAVLRPLRPRAVREPVVGGEVGVEKPTPDESGDHV